MSEACRQTPIVIESTTNGIWLRMGSESRLLWTTEASHLVDNLSEALQHCGMWTLNPPQVRALENISSPPCQHEA